MPDIQWDHVASLMRVTAFATAEPSEELVARGTVRELVGQAVALPVPEQDGLLIRAAGPGWTAEYDEPTIRELAARPEFTGARGAWDTAGRIDDPDTAEVGGGPYVEGGVSGPDETDARGRDGER